MGYTSIRQKETVAHVDSDTWVCGDKITRLHEFRCNACHGTMYWTYKPYERCPWCGFPVILYKETR